MTEQKLKLKVAEAVSLDREINELTGRLKEVEKELLQEAESRIDESGFDTGGGGRSIIFDGSDGCIARITFPAPTLKSSIDPEKVSGSKILELVGKWKEDLFVPVLKYGLVANFRDRVLELFDRKKANKIIKDCQSKSSPRVSYETKEVAA